MTTILHHPQFPLVTHIKSFTAHCTCHKLMPKLRALYASSTTKLSPTQVTENESIDRVRKEGMLHASAKCQKLLMGKVDWSPEFSTVQQQMILCQMVVHFKQGRKIQVGCIWWKAKWCGILTPLSCNLVHIRRAHNSRCHLPGIIFTFIYV